MKRKVVSVIFMLLAILVALNYSWLDSLVIGSLSDYEIVNVDRIIDGDTIEYNKTSVRLLGINSPEKKEPYYQEAKDFLEKELLNKTVRLEYRKDKKDKYNRTLAYVFLDNENINAKIIENGFANYYFPSGKDIYYNEFRNAWETCINNNKNLCEISQNSCAKCIELISFEHDSQEVVLFNKCTNDCNLNGWIIKDEGRKKFIFQDFVLKTNSEIKIIVSEGANTDEILYWKGEEYVWTRAGDTLFLRDSEGKLVLWRTY